MSKDPVQLYLQHHPCSIKVAVALTDFYIYLKVSQEPAIKEKRDNEAIGRAINIAKERLPEDHEIVIKISKNEISSAYYMPNDPESQIEGNSQSIVDDIAEALTLVHNR